MIFKEAYERLQEIHVLLQSDEMIDIDDLILLQEEAKKCYDICHEKLKKVTSDT